MISVYRASDAWIVPKPLLQGNLCSCLGYWSGRYSAMRDKMRQEMQENPGLYKGVRFLEEEDTEFTQTVFSRLVQAVVRNPLMDKDPEEDEYNQEDVEYLLSYRETVMKRLEIRNKKRYKAERGEQDDD